MIRSYAELMQMPTFEERYEYLKLGGVVGKETFGYERYLNQALYRSSEWKRLRNHIILRDNGNDLGCDGFGIGGKILIHHLNPITADDIVGRNPSVLDPENLICVSHNTHNAIHYGDRSMLVGNPVERARNDMCPWKR